MRYISTRGVAPSLEFADTILTGLARDGGLYVPESWPIIAANRLGQLAGLSYPELATEIMQPFVGDALPEPEFAALVQESYACFDIPDVVPLRQLTDGEYLLELFHGPTLAFKDIALQLLGRLFEALLTARGETMTIVGATSGDTGSAAIAATQGRENMQIFMLHPAGKVSDVQRRQMTTIDADNVFNIAVDGTFDDCQALVKAMFNDHAFRDRHHLGAVNSINWARVMAQTVYYFHAALKLGAVDGVRVRFSVPTGNFGDIFAGYVAKNMGLPMERLIVATNENDILYRALTQGDYSRQDVVETMSPAMDIQVSSNFERLLFDLFDRDGKALAAAMAGFGETGRLTLSHNQMQPLRAIFSTHRVNEEEVLATIAEIFDASGIEIDPHTAVGVAAGRATRGDSVSPLVTLSTAHPAKFPIAMARALGREPEMPERLQAVMEGEETYISLPNDLAAVQDYIAGLAR